MSRRYKDIDYRVTRSRRKTASIYIERDGQVFLRVPDHFTREDVEEVIESRRVWIYKSLAEWRDLNATRVVREFKNGEGFLYLGRSYRLRFVDDQDEPLKLKGGYFLLRHQNNGSGGSFTEAFKAFYREKGLRRITERVGHYAPRLGLEPGTVRVMELQNRWASCSDTGLNFHWKSMMAPTTVLDYIVVHELCHLKHPNHTEAFWNEVDKVMPEFRERREWLRRNGAGMGL